MKKILYIPIDTLIDNTVECTKLIKRGDTLTLQIKVFSNSVLADLTGQSIDLILRKSDGTLIEKTIAISNISNGVITATLSQQATLVQGLVSGEVQLYTTDTLSSTNTFTFNVDASLADDVLDISKNDIQVLADIRNLIASGEITIAKYENSVLAIGNSVSSIEALANIKGYIDTNLPSLEQGNASATVNIPNLKTENTKATNNIATLGELNNNAAILTQLLATLTSENDEAASNISSLTTKNNTAASNITELDAKNSTASTNKTNLDSENTRAEANIAALENFGDATQLAQDVNVVKTEMETARGGEANLDARLDKNDTLVASHSTQLSEIALFCATCAYASNVFTLTLNNPPPTLPNFYTIRFKATNAWVEGSTFKIGTKTYTPVNANFALNDVVIMNFDEVSGKSFSTGAPKTVLPTNLIYATTSNITYYVSPTGNDATGDGTIALPFKTIQYAINKLPQTINHIVTINVTAGTYSDGIDFTGHDGKGSIVVIGATTLANSVNFNVNSLKIENFSISISISGLKILNGVFSSNCYINNCSKFDIHNCTFDSLSWTYGCYIEYSMGIVYNCTISNKTYAIEGSNSIVISDTNTGVNNVYGLASVSSTIMKSSTQPTGSTMEMTISGGVIR